MGNYLCPSPPPPTLTGIYVALGTLLVFSILVISAVSWLACEMRNQRKLLEKLDRTRTAAELPEDERQPTVERDESCVGAIVEEYKLQQRSENERVAAREASAKLELATEELKRRGDEMLQVTNRLHEEYELQQRSLELLAKSREDEREAAREASAKIELAILLIRRGDEMLQVTNRLHEEITDVKRGNNEIKQGLDDLCANMEIPMDELMYTQMILNKMASYLLVLVEHSRQKAHLQGPARRVPEQEEVEEHWDDVQGGPDGQPAEAASGGEVLAEEHNMDQRWQGAVGDWRGQ